MQISGQYLDQCFTITLLPGQHVKVKLAETDGFFVIDFGHEAIRVLADIPDPFGRGGIDADGVANLIYEDNFYACPGCGSMPGDGVTKSCYHPDGCGYQRDAKSVS